MKNWMKVLLGAFLGSVIGAFLPAKVEFLHGLVRFFFDLSVNFGKYIFVPLVFFSLVIEVYEMYRQKTLKNFFTESGLYGCGCVAGCSVRNDTDAHFVAAETFPHYSRSGSLPCSGACGFFSFLCTVRYDTGVF